ncbi:MAG: hypothetical protein LBL81_04365 [Tannerella sp.]|jgi:hypothetical protein|nr:hypothetical protein [Tannerella sp.]
MGEIANDKMAKPWLTSGKKQRFLTMGSREHFVKTLRFFLKTLRFRRETLHCFCEVRGFLAGIRKLFHKVGILFRRPPFANSKGIPFFVETFERMPFKARELVLAKLEQGAKVAAKSTDAYWQYQNSLDAYRTALNVYDSAMEQGLEQGLVKGREQGLKQGREQGILEDKQDITRKLLARGLSVEDTSAITGLPAEKVQRIRDEGN